MNAHRFIAPLSCLAAFCALATAVRAQNVTTDPVGAITITLKGSSDTFVSLPFHRPVALETQVQSLSGNTITVNSTLANITASEFVYAAGTQSNTYYVQFTSGNQTGMYYTIVANDQSTITVDPNGADDLTGNSSVSPVLQPIAIGDTFRVIPYWTLNTLFPNGQGVNPSSGFTGPTRQSAIFFVDNASPGVNLSAATSYFYYNGSANGGPGWRQAGFPSVLVNDTVTTAIFYPDNYFFVRNSIAGDTQLTLVGAVPQSNYTTPLTIHATNTAQDIFIGMSVPIPVTLANSTLQQSGVFLPSTGFTGPTRGDQLFVFDNTVAAINRSSSATYFYYNGSANGGPGWRLAGDPNGTSTIHDNDLIFQPGNGYVLRKKATASPQTMIWSFTPTYLP